jgi:Protein of unknown function with HXXEE motif
MSSAAPATVPVTNAERRLGAALVVGAIAVQVVWLGLPALALSVGLAASYALWVGTAWRAPPSLRVALGVGILVFIAHFVEELLGGFPRELPALVGRPPWSDPQFVTFNGAWAAVFVLAFLTLKPGRALPVLPVLFLAVVGGLGNGIAHLLLGLQRGGYFPGLITAPLCLSVGLWLLRLLYGGGAGAGGRPSP